MSSVLKEIVAYLDSFDRKLHRLDVMAGLRHINPGTIGVGLAELVRKRHIKRPSRGFYQRIERPESLPDLEPWQNPRIGDGARIRAYLEARGPSPKAYVITAIDSGTSRGAIDEMLKVGDLHYTGDPGGVIRLGPHPRRAKSLAKPGAAWNGRRMMERGPNPAATAQPPPVPGGVRVIDLVRQDLDDRAAMGLAKYGTELYTHNGRDALIDAYQEALDQCMYLRQLIGERDTPPPGSD